jgi:UDP-N-acetylmuramate--alanine ligase
MSLTHERYHLVGVGGIGVSAVARLLHARGLTVQGSDVRESQITLALRALGVHVYIGHSPDHLEGVDVVVKSTAIPATNPELVAAAERGITIVHRSEVLGWLMDTRRSIGIIGTHGKGTVSGAITWLLEQAGEQPGYIIGGLLENFGDNARDGDNWLVAEVDESDGSLVNTRPNIAVLNNLELDHLNYYDSWEKLEASVVRFFVDNPNLELAVLNIDDPGVRKVHAAIVEQGTTALIKTFGFESVDADYRGTDHVPARMSGHFALNIAGAAVGEVRIGLPGAYNASNVLAAVAACHSAGIAVDALLAATQSYKGLENRFTLVDAAGVEVVKDYISHPTGIRRVLHAAREQAEGELVAVFKPYRFTMIHYLQDDYAEAFAGADRVVITELYTAGEVPIPGVDTDMLCRRIRERCDDVTYVHDMDAIASHLQQTVNDGATVLFFGGDDLFAVADGYVQTRMAGS